MRMLSVDQRLTYIRLATLNSRGEPPGGKVNGSPLNMPRSCSVPVPSLRQAIGMNQLADSALVTPRGAPDCLHLRPRCNGTSTTNRQQFYDAYISERKMAAMRFPDPIFIFVIWA